ncbi:TPA: hypothetical protein ACH3X1_009482 [Trebouxia sp. C0004]
MYQHVALVRIYLFLHIPNPYSAPPGHPLSPFPSIDTIFGTINHFCSSNMRPAQSQSYFPNLATMASILEDTKGGSALHLAATTADESADESAGNLSQSHGTPHAFTVGGNPQAAELRQLPSDFHTQLAGLGAVPLFAEPVQTPSPATDQLPAVDDQPAGLKFWSNRAPVEQMIPAQTISPSLTQTQPDLQQPRAACGNSAAAEPFQVPSECPFLTQTPSKSAKAGQTSADVRCNTCSDSTPPFRSADATPPAPQALPSPRRVSVGMTVNADIVFNGAGLVIVSTTDAGDMLSLAKEHLSSTVQTALIAAAQLPAPTTDAVEPVSPSAPAGFVHAGGLECTIKGQTALGPVASEMPDTKSKVSDPVAGGGTAGSQFVMGKRRGNGDGRSSLKPAGLRPAGAVSEATGKDQVVTQTPSKRKAGRPKKHSKAGKLLTPAASKQTSMLPQGEVVRSW